MYIVAMIFFIFFYIPIDKKRGAKSSEIFFLHKQNFLNVVEFRGDILSIEQLGSRYRSRVSICLKLKTIIVDSNQIIDGNQFFRLDSQVTNILLSPLYELSDKEKLHNMSTVHLNRNNNGKLKLYSLEGDSMDASRNLNAVFNTKTNVHCRDFVK